MNFDIKNAILKLEEMHEKSPRLQKDIVLKPYEHKEKNIDLTSNFIDNQTLNQKYFDL